MPKQVQAKKTLNVTPSRRTKQSREDQQDTRDARRALKEARKKGAVAWEQVKREVGI